ncbi:MAG: acyltransferase [Dokdonella sp.]
MHSLIVVPRVVAGFVLIVINTLVHSTPLLLLALVKFMVPLPAFRRTLSRVLIVLAESWIAVNSVLMKRLAGVCIDVEGLDGLSRDGWYLIISNHQSWVDIPVLQAVFNRRIPFLKFFLKRQLIWVPVLGLAWWALDFPFMRRYSKELLERKPHLRGKDIEATRKACEKYRELPVSVMNFVEGTRFTSAKHARQQSPYRHLLTPRAGGIAFVLDAMGEQLGALLDVTIRYPHGPPNVIDLLAGRVHRVEVNVRRLPIPTTLLGGDYVNDARFRESFQSWLNGLWEEKDGRLECAREARVSE